MERRRNAEKRTEEAKKDGKVGKFVVVGMRGRRRVVWADRMS